MVERDVGAVAGSLVWAQQVADLIGQGSRREWWLAEDSVRAFFLSADFGSTGI